MLTGLAVCAISNGSAAASVAVAVPPLPPLLEDAAPVVLTKMPAAGAVTVTLKAHMLPAAIVAPDRLMLPGAVVVSVPPQTVVDALATVSPGGNASAMATPLNATALGAGLPSVIVSVLDCPGAITAGVKAIAMVGGASTLVVAEAAAPKLPDGMRSGVSEAAVAELVALPAVAAVTVRVNCAAAPLSRNGAVQLTEPVAPTAG